MGNVKIETKKSTVDMKDGTCKWANTMSASVEGIRSQRDLEDFITLLRQAASAIIDPRAK